MNWSIESYPDGTLSLVDSSGNILAEGSRADITSYIDEALAALSDFKKALEVLP